MRQASLQRIFAESSSNLELQQLEVNYVTTAALAVKSFIQRDPCGPLQLPIPATPIVRPYGRKEVEWHCAYDRDQLLTD